MSDAGRVRVAPRGQGRRAQAAASEIVESVVATRPDAIALATVVSLAVRIEPRLLRRARLTLTPGLPASAESELWFSPLVSSWGMRAIVLRPDVAQELRHGLAREPDLLARSQLLVQRMHIDSAPTLRLEEDAIWAALTAGSDAANDTLARALATMLDRPDRARGISRWALRAIPALPAAARATDAALMLQAGAELRTSGAGGRLSIVPAELAPLIVPAGRRVPIGVELLAGGISISEPPASGAHVVDVPETRPLRLRIRPSGATGDGVSPAIARGSEISVAVGRSRGGRLVGLELTAADGEVYELSPATRPGARLILPGSLRPPPEGAERVGEVASDAAVEVSIYLRPGASLDWVDDEALRLPRERRYLSRKEFAGRYGARLDDIDATVTFAREHALDVTATDPARRVVSVRGAAPAVAAAFGAGDLGLFKNRDGPVFRARSGSLALPEEIAALVTGVFGIDERFSPGPRSVEREPQPEVTNYTAVQVAAAYDFPPSSAEGQTVGVIDFGGGFLADDLSSHFAALELPVPEVSVVSVDGGRQDIRGDALTHLTFTIEVVGAVAPGARIAVYVAPNVDRGWIDALSAAVHDSVQAPSVIAVGWGRSESTFTGQAAAELERILQEAAALGVTVIAAAGNQGSGEAAGQQVELPASAPHALACGGTTLRIEDGRIARETVWNRLSASGAGGGGFSSRFASPGYQRTVTTSTDPGAGQGGRGLPDVAACADPQTGYRMLVDGRAVVIGGTTGATALWAGLVARLNATLGAPVGFLQPLLYEAPEAAGLRDIAEGDTGRYQAATGWDPCTGLGTPNGRALLRFLRGGDRGAGLDTVQDLGRRPSDTLQVAARHMFALMMANVAGDANPITDPLRPDATSRPGCIIASPSHPGDLSTITQDYVYHWVRDAAWAAMEIAAAAIPAENGRGDRTLSDYTVFAERCQDSAPPTVGHACFTIDGEPRPWTEQADGPALQTLALLDAFVLLDDRTRQRAMRVIARNVEYLLTVYREPTTNMWEQHTGRSFFARAVQQRCLEAMLANPHGLAAPEGTADAIAWLRDALSAHWNGTLYMSMLPEIDGYDPNLDIVAACIYGAVACTDTRLLATASLLRSQWTDAGSPLVYPVNLTDRARGLGPLIGRYAADTYDGNRSDSSTGHPWPACTANFAELYYRVANAVLAGGAVPLDDLSAAFFGQVGVSAGTSPIDAATALTAAGDAILAALVHHSDDFHLPEQFDAVSGFVGSVHDLTWSYAAFLSALRARVTGR